MIRIGIICPSEIAFRRFMPALQQAEGIEFAGIAYASPEEWFTDVMNVDVNIISEQQKRECSKAQSFVDAYGGKIYKGYQSLLESDDIEAVYLPLPPALHYKWAKMALENGKHVLVEKPSTTRLEDTNDLVKIASEKNLALHENYMFIFHNQLKAIDDVVKSGEIGDVRLYRISFGFPRRTKNDFRYNKALGGGALLDAGGYTIKYADYLLGNTAKVVTAHVNYTKEFEVEMYGSATMTNADGVTAQLAFGMDNDYKCEVEIWGSQGTITSNRILTAPVGYIPTYNIKKNQDVENKNLPADDAFLKSIQYFVECINDRFARDSSYAAICRQEYLVEEFKNVAMNNDRE